MKKSIAVLMLGSAILLPTNTNVEASYSQNKGQKQVVQKIQLGDRSFIYDLCFPKSIINLGVLKPQFVLDKSNGKYTYTSIKSKYVKKLEHNYWEKRKGGQYKPVKPAPSAPEKEEVEEQPAPETEPTPVEPTPVEPTQPVEQPAPEPEPAGPTQPVEQPAPEPEPAEPTQPVEQPTPEPEPTEPTQPVEQPEPTEPAEKPAPSTPDVEPAPTPTNPAPTTPETNPSTPVEETNNASLSAIEREVLNLTNAERQKRGLAPLRADDANLMSAARAKSADMATNRYFSHTSPKYGSPFNQMKAFGVTYRSAAENIAMGQRSAQQVVNSWMNSPGHRQNILTPNYTHIGIGYDANGHYWTQQFIQK